MFYKKVRMKLSGEKTAIKISGEAAKSALGRLYEKLINSEENHNFGMAGIEMFFELFGDKITEKILRYCEENPDKAVREFGRIIKHKIYPLAVKQRKYEDRQGVKKYL
ncbi:MAG: hypothetical protein FWE74_10760 [Oscillospiraceae bacterium]|nr:hypothetical protein [Oscillospiraceae bacterium]